MPGSLKNGRPILQVAIRHRQAAVRIDIQGAAKEGGGVGELADLHRQVGVGRDVGCTATSHYQG